MKKLGVCVVGLGFVGGQAHVPSINKIKNARLVAVCDMNEALAEKYSRKYNCKKYLSTKDALKDPEISAVIIAVPTPFHYKVAMEFINAGKHVLLEMPLGVTMSQTNRLISSASKAGVTLMPSLNFRFAPVYNRIKRMVEKEKTLGKGAVAVHYREYISANLLANQWPPGAWAWDKKKSGGPLFTLSVWSIDLLRWLLKAEIKKLSAVAENHKLAKYNGTSGYMGYAIAEFTNGVIASMQYSGGVCKGQTQVTLELVGENTNIIKALDTDTIKVYSDDEAGQKIYKLDVSGPRVWGHFQEDEDFVNSVLKGKSPEITPEDGRIATAMGLEIAKMYR